MTAKGGGKGRQGRRGPPSLPGGVPRRRCRAFSGAPGTRSPSGRPIARFGCRRRLSETGSRGVIGADDFLEPDCATETSQTTFSHPIARFPRQKRLSSGRTEKKTRFARRDVGRTRNFLRFAGWYGSRTEVFLRFAVRSVCRTGDFFRCAPRSVLSGGRLSKGLYCTRSAVFRAADPPRACHLYALSDYRIPALQCKPRHRPGESALQTAQARAGAHSCPSPAPPAGRTGSLLGASRWSRDRHRHWPEMPDGVPGP